MLSKPIDRMTHDECMTVAAKAGLAIGLREEDNGWRGLYASGWRSISLWGSEMSALRQALIYAAREKGLLDESGHVILPDAEPPTLEQIDEWTEDECKLFVLANLPEGAHLMVGVREPDYYPLVVRLVGGRTFAIGQHNTVPTLEDWRAASRFVHAQVYPPEPAPPKIADMTEEQCEAALADLGAEWRIVELPHEDGSVTYVGWRLTATTDEWSRARGSKDRCEVMQSIVRWAAHDLGCYSREADSIKPAPEVPS